MMRKLRLALVILVLCAVFVTGVWLTYVWFTSRHVGGNDFYSRWVGGCALLRERANPYSEAITLRIQEGMYGRPAYPDEDQVAFAYPLYCLFFFWPLCYITPYPLVQSIWLWGLLAALIGAVTLWLRAIRWQPRLELWTATMVWSVFMYHNLRALLLGQFVVLSLLMLVTALLVMKRGYDGWAGFFLALSTLKPQMVYLAIPWILLWSGGQKRWRLWWGFGGSLSALILGPMLLLPSWIPDFVRQAVTYPSYTVYGSLTWMIVRHVLGLGPAVEIGVTIALVLGGIVLGWQLHGGTWDQMLWMLGLLLLLTNCFTPRIATTNYVMLVPWVLWGFRHMQRAWGRRGTWAVVGIEAISLIGLWAVFLATVEGDFERAPAYFPFPVMSALILAWLWGKVRK